MKKLLLLAIVSAFAFTLTACEEDGNKEEKTEEVVVLENLTIEGIENSTVAKNGTFNVLEGVTVTGNDNEDYTSFVKVYLSGCGVDENNDLYTQASGTCYIEYIAVVEGIFVKESREVTIR